MIFRVIGKVVNDEGKHVGYYLCDIKSRACGAYNFTETAKLFQFHEPLGVRLRVPSDPPAAAGCDPYLIYTDLSESKLPIYNVNGACIRNTERYTVLFRVSGNYAVEHAGRIIILSEVDLFSLYNTVKSKTGDTPFLNITCDPASGIIRSRNADCPLPEFKAAEIMRDSGQILSAMAAGVTPTSATNNSTSSADAAIRAAEAKRAEEARKAELARKQAEEARRAEEARKAEEARRAEEVRKAELARMQAEEAKKQAEMAQRQAEEAQRQAEEAKKRTSEEICDIMAQLQSADMDTSIFLTNKFTSCAIDTDEMINAFVSRCEANVPPEPVDLRITRAEFDRMIADALSGNPIALISYIWAMVKTYGGPFPIDDFSRAHPELVTNASDIEACYLDWYYQTNFYPLITSRVNKFLQNNQVTVPPSIHNISNFICTVFGEKYSELCTSSANAPTTWRTPATFLGKTVHAYSAYATREEMGTLLTDHQYSLLSVALGPHVGENTASPSSMLLYQLLPTYQPAFRRTKRPEVLPTFLRVINWLSSMNIYDFFNSPLSKDAGINKHIDTVNIDWRQQGWEYSTADISILYLFFVSKLIGLPYSSICNNPRILKYMQDWLGKPKDACWYTLATKHAYKDWCEKHYMATITDYIRLCKAVQQGNADTWRSGIDFLVQPSIESYQQCESYDNLYLHDLQPHVSFYDYLAHINLMRNLSHGRLHIRSLDNADMATAVFELKQPYKTPGLVADPAYKYTVSLSDGHIEQLLMDNYFYTRITDTKAVYLDNWKNEVLKEVLQDSSYDNSDLIYNQFSGNSGKQKMHGETFVGHKYNLTLMPILQNCFNSFDLKTGERITEVILSLGRAKVHTSLGNEFICGRQWSDLSPIAELDTWYNALSAKFNSLCRRNKIAPTSFKYNGIARRINKDFGNITNSVHTVCEWFCPSTVYRLDKPSKTKFDENSIEFDGKYFKATSELSVLGYTLLGTINSLVDKNIFWLGDANGAKEMSADERIAYVDSLRSKIYGEPLAAKFKDTLQHKENHTNDGIGDLTAMLKYYNDFRYISRCRSVADLGDTSRDFPHSSVSLHLLTPINRMAQLWLLAAYSCLEEANDNGFSLMFDAVCDMLRKSSLPIHVFLYDFMTNDIHRRLSGKSVRILGLQPEPSCLSAQKEASFTGGRVIIFDLHYKANVGNRVIDAFGFHKKGLMCFKFDFMHAVYTCFTTLYDPKGYFPVFSDTSVELIKASAACSRFAAEFDTTLSQLFNGILNVEGNLAMFNGLGHRFYPYFALNTFNLNINVANDGGGLARNLINETSEYILCALYDDAFKTATSGINPLSWQGLAFEDLMYANHLKGGVPYIITRYSPSDWGASEEI